MTSPVKRRLRVVLMVILGAVAALFYVIPRFFSAPAPLSGHRNYNIIIISIDALRADHLGVYGYTQPTSPFIDQVARQGAVFLNSRANSSYTRESVSVLFTGRLPAAGNTPGWYAQPGTDFPTLAELFSRAGYHTHLLCNNSFALDHPSFKRGFESTWFNSLDQLSGNAPELTQRACGLLRKYSRNPEPFLFYLHYLDPHAPYQPPRSSFDLMGAPFMKKVVPVYDALRQNASRLIAMGFGPGNPHFNNLVGRYDGEIAHVDQSLGKLFQTLQDCGFHKNTMVIITSDHGEEFLEHGYVEHGWTLYEEVLRVPLIFWAPEILTPMVSRNPVSSVDILPTLTTLWDIDQGFSRFDGVPLFAGGDKGLSLLPATRRPFIGELLIQHRSILRTVTAGSWKYLAAWRYLPSEKRFQALQDRTEIEDNPGRHTDSLGPVIHRELYNLTLDPGERKNRIQSDPKIAGRLHRQLMRYLRYCRRRGFNRIEDTGPRQSLSPADREKLKSLGYM